MHVELLPGFRKANVNNIPQVSSEMIFRFVQQISADDKSKELTPTNSQDLRVDYLQVQRSAEVIEVHGVVFPAATSAGAEGCVKVSLKIHLSSEEIVESACVKCSDKPFCSHVLAFIFWLHRITNENDVPMIRDFWGSETESVVDDQRPDAIRIRDIFVCDENRLQADLDGTAMVESDGQNFLETVLDELTILGHRDAALINNCRPSINEFESIFVHHTLLDASNNFVKDTNSFVQYMEDQAKQGIFERFAEVSKENYKTPLWLEMQYMRLRCSLIHRIATRKDNEDDESILENLFCKNRDNSSEERQNMKTHKRFILKQTEKLEDKVYQECGILLNENYPYICATPDGITDDHIVEIKAPKTEEEFEKYLEGRETIAPKYMAQIQIQMYMANVTKALYCVLSPTFDTNGALHYVWVQADMEFVASLLSAAEDFWRDVVFPRLAKVYLLGQ